MPDSFDEIINGVRSFYLLSNIAFYSYSIDSTFNKRVFCFSNRLCSLLNFFEFIEFLINFSCSESDSRGFKKNFFPF